MPFDLLTQNNASKEIFLISGLTDYSDTSLAYIFENFNMPEKAQEGEYTCALFRNGRRDVEYEFSDVLLDTVAHTAEGDVKIKYLRPEIFLMKYGENGTDYVYRSKNKEYVYRKK